MSRCETGMDRRRVSVQVRCRARLMNRRISSRWRRCTLLLGSQQIEDAAEVIYPIRLTYQINTASVRNGPGVAESCSVLSFPICAV